MKIIDHQVIQMRLRLQSKRLMFAEEFKALQGWSKRKCRDTANHSGGHIISGNFGYVLTTRATPEEYAEYVRRNDSQIKQTKIRRSQSAAVRNG